MNKVQVMNAISSKEKKYFLFLLFILLLFILNESKAQSKTWIAPKEVENVKNPLAGNTEVLKDGKVIYTTYCRPCHGDKGKGDGIAAAGLATKPADHTSDIVQKQTDGALHWMITEGRDPMPTYKTTLTENQRWELVTYIRSIAKTKK